MHLCGNLDVFNYGDVLFPLLARHRLGPLGYKIVPVAPTDRVTWPDAIAPVSLQQMFRSDESRGVLIGGGHIISDMPINEFLRVAAGQYELNTWIEAYFSGLWLGATLYAASIGAPVAWNAPGVMRPFVRREIRALAEAAIAVAERACVRDAESQRFLGPRAASQVALSPDTIIEISAMWPRPALEPGFRELVTRAGVSGSARFMAVQVRPVLMDEDEPAIAARITRFARDHALVPILIGIGPALGDDAAARRLSQQLACPHVLLDRPASLAEVTAALAFSAVYVGQSLHGCIVASSYEVPGVIVARRTARRLSGFLAYRGTPELMCDSWEEALARAASLPSAAPLPPAMLEALDDHWARIAQMLERPADKSRERLAFLQLYARLGLRHLGADWSFKPFLPSSYGGPASA